MATDNLKPFNLQAEYACIYAMIKDPRCYSDGLARLSSSEFFDKASKSAFEILLSLYEKKVDVDEVTVFEEAKVMGVDNLVDKDYLRNIQQYTFAISNFQEVIKIIHDNSSTRNLFNVFGNLTKRYTNNEFDSLDDFLTVSKGEISNVLDTRDVSDFLNPKTVVDELSQKLEEAKRHYTEADITGLSTGFRDLDKLTLGLQPGNMIILAARPGIGKTSLALNIAQNVSKTKGAGPVGIFSQEMDATELYQRILSFETKIDLKDLSRGKFNQYDETNIANAKNKLKEGRIFVDQTPGIEFFDLVAKAKKLKANYPNLSLIIIDHVGLIKNKTMDNKNNVSRTESLGFISRNLKQLAKELNIPILVLCQLSRKVDDNPGRRPMLSNLSESGHLEMDADLVLGMSILDPNSNLAKNAMGRYSVGNKKTPNATDADKLQAKQEAANAFNEALRSNKIKEDANSGIILIDTLKNRNGPKLRVLLEWIGRYTCFYTLTEEAVERIMNAASQLDAFD